MKSSFFLALGLDPQAQSRPLSGLGLVSNQSGMASLQKNSPGNNLGASHRYQHQAAEWLHVIVYLQV